METLFKWIFILWFVWFIYALLFIDQKEMERKALEREEKKKKRKFFLIRFFIYLKEKLFSFFRVFTKIFGFFYNSLFRDLILKFKGFFSKIGFILGVTSLIIIMYSSLFILTRFYGRIMVKFNILDQFLFDSVRSLCYIISILLVIYFLKKVFDLACWYRFAYYKYHYAFTVDFLVETIEKKINKKIVSVFFVLFLMILAVLLVLLCKTLVLNFCTLNSIDFADLNANHDEIISFKFDYFGFAIVVERVWAESELTYAFIHFVSNMYYPGTLDFLEKPTSYWEFFFKEEHKDVFMDLSVKNANGSMNSLLANLREFKLESSEHLSKFNEEYLIKYNDCIIHQTLYTIAMVAIFGRFLLAVYGF